MEDAENSVAVSDASQNQERPTTELEQETPKRNKNLDILQTYIKQQRALLERIRGDLDRLNDSRQSISNDAAGALASFLQPRNIDNNECEEKKGFGFAGVSKLRTLIAEVQDSGEPGIMKGLDWNLFKGLDASPLLVLKASRVSAMAPVKPVHPHPSSGLSSDASLSAHVGLIPERRPVSHIKVSARSLQIRELRASLVDPVLTRASEFMASLSLKLGDERAKLSLSAASAVQQKETRPPRTKNPKLLSKRSKAAHRKKGDVNPAATVRPRGHGGRFKKLDRADGDTVMRSQTVQLSPTATVHSFQEPSALTPSSLNSTLPHSLPSASSLHNFEDDMLLERSQRVRRPPTRYMSPTASVGSGVTSTRTSARRRSGTHASASSREHTSTSTSPSVEMQPRLTIRIPAQITTRPPEPPVSVSLATSLSVNTSSTISTASGSATATGERNSYSPATTVRSMSSVQAIGVKQEEDDMSHMMEVDSIGHYGGVEGESAAGRSNNLNLDAEPGFSPEHLLPEDARNKENDLYSDSDDSFVCELLPPRELEEKTSYSVPITADSALMNGNGLANDARRLGSPSTPGPLSKPTTFNQSWSDEEQKLLDILLQQYPDGTRNRWSNISKAMGGRRTPRQVASRVQKYFAKMKKWGIDLR